MDSEVQIFCDIKADAAPKIGFQVVYPSSDSQKNGINDFYKLYFWIIFCANMHCFTFKNIASSFELKNTQKSNMKL